MSSEPSVPAIHPVRLEDYAPPPYLIETVILDVDIRAGESVVSATLACLRNPAVPGAQALTLDGEDLETLSVSLDGELLAPEAYRLDASRLTIDRGDRMPERFTLQTRVRIRPDENTRLSGFYRSRDGYFTQCEPEGFRRITLFIDRPDVMARYTVTLHADRGMFPTLLANGNPAAQGDEQGGRHLVTWKDPFRKPS